LDSDTELAVLKALNQVAENCTTIFIAHRISTIQHCDKIIVLSSQGSILEQGTHQELLEKNGLYKELWKTQQQVHIYT